MGYKCASKEKKKERKKVNQSKIGEKQKRKIEKKKNTERFSLYQTMSEQCAELSKEKRREIVTITWLKPEGCMKQSPS